MKCLLTMVRSLQPELMDSPRVTGETLARFHRDLSRVHFFLGTHSTILRFIESDSEPVRRILDIGCGDGHLLEYLKRKTGSDVIGVDRKPVPHPVIPILEADAVCDPLPRADVAVCSLLNHHLTPEENVLLIRNVARCCRRLLILDLVRHPLPFILFSIFLCPLLGHEAAADGRQSIRRAFTPEEFQRIACTALASTGGTVQIDVSPFRSRQVLDIRF